MLKCKAVERRPTSKAFSHGITRSTFQYRSQALEPSGSASRTRPEIDPLTFQRAQGRCWTSARCACWPRTLRTNWISNKSHWWCRDPQGFLAGRDHVPPSVMALAGAWCRAAEKATHLARRRGGGTTARAAPHRSPNLADHSSSADTLQARFCADLFHPLAY